MLKLSLSGLALCVSVAVFAQDFAIRKVEIALGKVILHYTLLDSVQRRNYTINVYSSKDNFIAPLDDVSGDVGLEVKPGGNKRIVWDPVAEYGKDFNGKISLEVRGRVYIPFVRFDGFEDYKSVKRGKDYEITWSGGTPQNILNFELYKGDKKVTAFPNIANVGHHTIKLPTSIKPGSDYKFKITDSKNKDEIVYTSNFRVKRKVPLALKVIPVVAVGAAIYLVTSSADEKEGDDSLIDPIGPPNQ
jgi:hypothetical protein